MAKIAQQELGDAVVEAYENRQKSIPVSKSQLEQLKQYTCTRCSSRPIDNDKLVHVSCIRIRQTDKPGNHGWKIIEGRWVCGLCLPEFEEDA